MHNRYNKKKKECTLYLYFILLFVLFCFVNASSGVLVHSAELYNCLQCHIGKKGKIPLEPRLLQKWAFSSFVSQFVWTSKGYRGHLD